ncbi:MAG: Dam family site-specific DNA-(adenine-N6)-methyltransferase [Chloroflexi bacterium]|nr:Dam family site-specific DNA-(adenine-N6)-methyltransferase [Chloroflexota bacterium]
MTLPELNPPLKWAGGKRWLVPYLQPIWSSHSRRRLVEPFCGGLAVPLGLRPERALLSDINPHLINFFRQLQRGLESNLVSADNDKELFYQRRERFNTFIQEENYETAEAALLFYYLNRTGYNGLCRFNSQGLYNVPKGSYKTINYMTTSDFAPYQEALANWEFRVGDFEDLDLLPGDFVYADPPYDVPFTQYSKENFNWEDQVRLAEWLAQHDGPVILSNQATKRIRELYNDLGFTMTVLEAPRRINSNGDRTPAQEVLAYRNVDVFATKNREVELSFTQMQMTPAGLEPATN